MAKNFSEDDDNRSYPQAQHSECIFSIESIEEDALTIRDQSAAFGGKTITNAAEQVVKKLHNFLKNKSYKIYYIDSQNKKGQLLYNDKLEFTGFKT